MIQTSCFYFYDSYASVFFYLHHKQSYQLSIGSLDSSSDRNQNLEKQFQFLLWQIGRNLSRELHFWYLSDQMFLLNFADESILSMVNKNNSIAKTI